MAKPIYGVNTRRDVKINDQERVLWVDNDEGLNSWRLSERMGVWAFVRKYRKEITEYIERASNRS